MQKDCIEPFIAKSLDYAIMYNGDCYKLISNKWIKSEYQISKNISEKMYSISPAEIDSNL